MHGWKYVPFYRQMQIYDEYPKHTPRFHKCCVQSIADSLGETDLLRCVQKLLQLRNAAQLDINHIDHHPWMIKPPVQLQIRCLRLISGWKYARPSGSHLVGQGCYVTKE